MSVHSQAAVLNELEVKRAENQQILVDTLDAANDLFGTLAIIVSHSLRGTLKLGCSKPSGNFPWRRRSDYN